MSIYFNNADRKFVFHGKRKLKQSLLSLVALENKTILSLHFVFCSDSYLLNINNQFLQHDYFTDIITFDLRDNLSEPLEGEVYISVDRVKENAVLHSVTYQTEMQRVVYHGTLHLCGYNDKTKNQQTIMRQKEDFYLAQFPLSP